MSSLVVIAAVALVLGWRRLRRRPVRARRKCRNEARYQRRRRTWRCIRQGMRPRGGYWVPKAKSRGWRP